MDSCVLKQLDFLIKPYILAIMNHKGGVGKSALTDALIHLLVEQKKRVLLMDFDPQHNISQTLQIPEMLFYENKVNEFFLTLGKSPDFINQLNLFPIYITDSVSKEGVLGIIAGDQDIINSVNYAANTKSKDIFFEKFIKSIEFYQKYFDYIIIDTAPTLNSLVNELVMCVADNIIIPFDGIEAVMGIEQFVDSVNKNEYKYKPKPNALFVLNKFQRDTKDVKAKYQYSNQLKKGKSKQTKGEYESTIYRIMKNILGDYVCDVGIPERQVLKNHTYTGLRKSFDVKDSYKRLVNEILFKIDQDMPNVFDMWSEDKLEKRLYEHIKPLINVKNRGKTNTFGSFVFE
jgi:cellulose biosynthesis protein BcsQ